MNILFVDGFDYGDNSHMMGASPCKYTQYSSTGPGSIVPGNGGGNAINWGNNVFSQQTITRILRSSGATFCLGVDTNVRNYTSPGKSLFRYECGGVTLVHPSFFDDGTNSTTCLMVEVMLNGSIQVCVGAGGTPNFPGTVLWNSGSAYTYPLRTWVYLELQVDTSAGTWALYADDVLLQAQTGVTMPTGIDRFSLMAFGFEEAWVDNVYLTDGDRLGPCHVWGFPPNFQSTHMWTPLSGTNLSQIQEFGNRPLVSTPDDNLTYVQTNASAAIDLFGFAAPPCFGRILAVALNVDCEATVSSPAILWMIRQSGVDTFLGTSPALIGGYSIQQAVQLLSPATGTFWTDQELGSALFGYQFLPPGTARVTQFMLEKLVSLRDVPYDCGQGNYSFTS